MALPPGPRIPAVVQTYLFIKHTLRFFDELLLRYGDIFTIELTGIGKSVHVVRPESIRELFIAAPEYLHAGDSNSVVEPLIGKQAIAILDENDHARVRRLLKGPLHGEKMRAHGPTIMDATRYAVRDFRPGDTRSMLTLMQDISLEVILRVIFGITERSALPVMAKNVLQMVTAYTPALLVVPQLRHDLGAWSPWGRFVRRRKVVDDWLLGEIAARRKRPDPRRTDVLSALVLAQEANEAPLSDDEIRDQIVTLFVAGQDTTSAALTWAMCLLHNNPRTLERLLAELDSLGPEPHPDKMAELPYLNAVCNEALRTTTTVPAASRMPVKKAMQIQGYDIEPGMYLSPNIYLAHHNPAVYPDPFAFRPERFLEREYSPYEFLPFGGGARRCLGMALSYFEMRLVLGTLLKELRFRPVLPEVAPHHLRGMVLVPKDGGMMHVTERRGESFRVAA
jgi:cytochrome P450